MRRGQRLLKEYAASSFLAREYTRLDGMIDVMFTTAKGAADAVKETVGPEADADPNHGPTAVGVEQSEKTWQFTDSEVLRALRERIIGAVGHAQGVKFLRKSGALYWNADHDKRAGPFNAQYMTRMARIA